MFPVSAGGETYGSFPLHNVRSEGLQFTPQASNEEEIPSPATAAMGVEIDAATVARSASACFIRGIYSIICKFVNQI